VSISVDIPPDYIPSLNPAETPELVQSFEDFVVEYGITRTVQVLILDEYGSIRRNSINNKEQYDYCSMSDSEIKSLFQNTIPVPDYPGITLRFDSVEKRSFGGMCGLLLNSTSSSTNEDDPLFALQTVFLFGYFNKNLNKPRYVTLNCYTIGYMFTADKVKDYHSVDFDKVCLPYFNSLKVYDN
jgi:hypothetical protein